MLGEKILGTDASCLRRFGALSGLLCGTVALLGLLLVTLQPTFENFVALFVCAGMAGAGVVAARRDTRCPSST